MRSTLKRGSIVLMLAAAVAACGGSGAAKRTATPGQAAAGETTEATRSAALPAVVVGVVADAMMEYYDVTGATFDQLRASMDAHRPVDRAGRRYDAFTAWNINWTWPHSPDSSCALSGATVNTTITVTFPRWQPPPEASAALVERWNAYETAVVVHENGHVSYVIQTVGDVVAAIKGATCDTAEAAAQAVLARIRQHDLDYDAATLHGLTQGAYFR